MQFELVVKESRSTTAGASTAGGRQVLLSPWSPMVRRWSLLKVREQRSIKMSQDVSFLANWGPSPANVLLEFTADDLAL